MQTIDLCGKIQQALVFSLLTMRWWWFRGKGEKREDSEVPCSGRNNTTLRFWAVNFIWPEQNSIWKFKGIMSWKSLSYVQLSQQNQCSGPTSASTETDTPCVGCWGTGPPGPRAASWGALDLAGPYLHSWKSSFPRVSPVGLPASDLCPVHVSPEGPREITLGL